MTALKKVKSHPDIVEYSKELPFHKKHIKKTKIKRLKTLICFLDFLFMKTNHAFRGYARSYKVKMIEKKDPIKQLETSKSSIKDLFRDLLNETKGLKYQIALKVTLKNTSQMEKLNLDQFISIQQQKQ